MKKLVLFLLMATPISLFCQGLEITLKNGTDKERRGKEQLERIIKQYQNQINQWIYTTKIVIDENAIPFSHPVLTLNCNYPDNDLQQLANFLHEQFHWLEEQRSEQREGAISEFKSMFPDVPVKGGTGARSSYSTYLHLIVCDLEYQAMTKVVGEKNTREILSGWKHYTWIYDKVLNDQRIRDINQKHGFFVLE